MFKKAAIFGDLHLGKRSDSAVHNEDCLNYINWFCEQASKHKVDQIIFLGDWFDNRSRIRLDTIQAGSEALLRLRDVAPVTMIVGNHDMYYRDNRSIHSLGAYKEWPGVTVIDELTVIGNAGFVPYLIGSEYLQVLEMDCDYMFGHFELPTFLMNSTIEMPDRGQFNANQIQRPKMVMSGHFHKRQLKINTSKVPVWYIGNPFGHDFNDLQDNERGMVILENGGDPQFIDWKDGPYYQRFKTSEIVDILENDDLDKVTRSTSILEIKDDLNLDLEDITAVREELLPLVREVRVIQGVTTPGMDVDADVEEMDEKPLGQIVTEHLSQIDPHGSNIKPDLLVKLYEGGAE